MSAVLHPSSQVLTLRHGASWGLLSMSAGAVNAGAFLACERFVTHVTGTVTQIGVDYGMWELFAEYTAVLVSFILGAMASVFALQARVFRGKRPLHALPLFAVTAVLLSTGAAGYYGVFGPLGGQVEEANDFFLLCVLAFAMGLMNASVATSTDSLVRTTHLTGPATDLGVHLSLAWVSSDEQRKQSLRLAALRAVKLVAFAIGAAVMVPLMRGMGYLAFGVPALMVFTAAVRSFLVPDAPRDRTQSPRAHSPELSSHAERVHAPSLRSRVEEPRASTPAHG